MMMLTAVLVLCGVVGTWATIPSSADQQVIVDKHNGFRKLQGASDMNKLTWDDTLAATAEAHVSTCKFDHTSDRTTGENFHAASQDGPLSATATTAKIDHGIQRWYDEIAHYDYESGNSTGTTGHYTQVVWAETTLIGCATKVCDTLVSVGLGFTKSDMFFLGCWYKTGGNNGNKPFQNGTACSECGTGQSCDDGLCTGVVTVACADVHQFCAHYLTKPEISCDEGNIYHNFMKTNCYKTCGFC